ncbi:MAG: small subunit ribosomal protein S2 [archaeon GW2011_AR17]|nr:MAG: small subunit ribosomal protein S2 [archaeon GW2011_AR17]MBS3154200.1 30S ribosomal protein S2 [Candidatus Woesearchaeota archaeon]HIH14762.1 30S ribosomal protein S2 [Nanoarchaeota archaeon]HIH58686.1 30S ribosomal protein S2 [Nanoarchaeota archaeon]HII14474.1 30S ribosomal protein S2 [Nanoarchaeota archaeon]
MAEEQEVFLTPLENYLKVGLHIGTKFRTKYMAPFIYKVRPDGLAVLNVKKIDERIEIAAKFLAQYDTKDILVVCRRENGWAGAKLFHKLTGIPVIAGRYRPGLLTNPALEDFKEIKILFVTDPWPDKNAVMDAVRTGIPVVACCDTNNESNYVDLVVPCNNKGKKSLGLMFYLLGKEYMKARGTIKSEEELSIPLEEFIKED